MTSVAEVFKAAVAQGQVHTSRDGWNVVNAILNCRTEVLGGHLYRCSDCGKDIPLYNSCRNRHCPKCQGEARARWLEARRAELLSVPYFHLVFTVPHELNGIFLQNKGVLFDILFRSVTKTLRDVAQRRFAGTLGFFSVLHSWGRKMEFHPHIHTIVPGIIVGKDGSVQTSKQNYLLPKRVLATVFRAIFIRALVKAYRQNKLSLLGNEALLQVPSLFFNLIKKIKQKDWVCYAKKPFSGPDVVLKYLACYTHKVAISEKRIIALKDGQVTFSYKDYADHSRKKLLTISVAEFTRRFLLHTLPPAFVRIRYAGFLAPAKRKKVLSQLKQHFKSPIPAPQTFSKDRSCPHCGSIHLTLIHKLFPVRYSSLAHKTKVLPLVA